MKKENRLKTIIGVLIALLVFMSIWLFVNPQLNTSDNSTDTPSQIKPTGPKLSIDGKEVTLSKPKLKVGDKLKTDYELDKPASVIEKQETMSLKKVKGYRVFETVPSLDTPVCSMQTAELNLLSPNYKDVEFVIISMDLPFAQQRYCGVNDIGNIHVLSDYKNREFSNVNGLLISENQLNARAIFVVDEEDKVVYVEYADEQTRPLDLQKALESIN